MPKLPNSLRGPGGKSRPSGKGERYHGPGLLFFVLTGIAAFVLSLLLSWAYFFALADGPDPWGWSAIGVILACVWAALVFPILAAVSVAVSRLLPGIGKTLTGYSMALVAAALLTPFATHGFILLMIVLKGS